MTFQHRAGVTPYTSACAFAESCVFGKQSLGPFHCGSYLYEHSFSLSYGVILQSSLAIVLSLTLGFSPHPCVSIFGTGHIYLTLETFLGSSSTAFRTRRSFPYASRLLVSDGGFACHPDISLAPALPAAGCSFLSPSFLHIYTGTGISTCCPSTTPFGLALGPDYPREDEPSSGNLGFSVRGILTHVPLLTPAFSLP